MPWRSLEGNIVLSEFDAHILQVSFVFHFITVEICLEQKLWVVGESLSPDELEPTDVAKIHWTKILRYNDQETELLPHTVALGCGVLLVWIFLIWRTLRYTFLPAKTALNVNKVLDTKSMTLLKDELQRIASIGSDIFAGMESLDDVVQDVQDVLVKDVSGQEILSNVECSEIYLRTLFPDTAALQNDTKVLDERLDKEVQPSISQLDRNFTLFYAQTTDDLRTSTATLSNTSDDLIVAATGLMGTLPQMRVVPEIRSDDLNLEDLATLLENASSDVQDFQEQTKIADEAVVDLSRVLVDSSFEDSAANETALGLLGMSELIQDSELRSLFGIIPGDLVDAFNKTTARGELCVHQLRARLEYINATKLTLTEEVHNATLRLIELDEAIRNMIYVGPVTFVSYAGILEEIGSILYSPVAENLDEWAGRIDVLISQMRSFPDIVDFSSYLLQIRLDARRVSRLISTSIKLFGKYETLVSNLETYLDYEDEVDLEEPYSDFWDGDLASFLRDINPMAAEVGVEMVDVTILLRSILEQTVARGELGLGHILGTMIGTVDKYNLATFSRNYASNQYKGTVALLVPMIAVTILLMISFVWNHEAGANILALLLIILLVGATTAAYIEARLLRSGNDLCHNLDGEIIRTLLDDTTDEKGRQHVSGLLNHVVYNTYETQGIDVVEGLFLINTTQTNIEIEEFRRILAVLMTKYGLRGESVALVARSNSTSEVVQTSLGEYHESIKHEPLGNKYRDIKSGFCCDVQGMVADLYLCWTGTSVFILCTSVVLWIYLGQLDRLPASKEFTAWGFRSFDRFTGDAKYAQEKLEFSKSLQDSKA
ncbi:hypothetical protein BSKO_03398 [Bryopsis sp. KO-2023]|nr:hypothetical protein BSKO_03398 [Bryopsis sp. KO-2023]